MARVSEESRHPLLAYEAAQAAVALADLGTIGLCRFAGPGRKDFLQGLLTCDLSRSAPGHAVRACLLTPHGKLVAEMWLNEGEDDYVAVSLDAAAPARMRTALAKHLLLADVAAEDLSDRLHGLFLAGPKAAQVMEEAFGRPVPSALAALELSSAGAPVRVFRSPLFGAEGFLIASPPGAVPSIRVLCAKAGARHGFRPLPPETVEMLRIEAGLPRFGVDVTGDNYPVEANLSSAVSDDKGCYLGQETTARLRSRGKPAHRLTALRTEASAAPGAAVSVGGKDVARTTSAAPSPKLGGHLSLALLPWDEAAAGRPVAVDGRPGIVVDFPGGAS